MYVAAIAQQFQLFCWLSEFITRANCLLAVYYYTRAFPKGNRAAQHHTIFLKMPLMWLKRINVGG